MSSMTMPNITPHARERFVERFATADIASELANAIPFGAQLGDRDQLMLSPCGAVFAVRDQRVVTVLTKQQALANMQSIIGHFAANTSGELSAIPAPAVTQYEREVAKELAHQHAARDDQRGCQPKTSKRERLKELRGAGLAIESPPNPAQKLYHETYIARRAELNRQFNERMAK